MWHKRYTKFQIELFEQYQEEINSSKCRLFDLFSSLLLIQPQPFQLLVGKVICHNESRMANRSTKTIRV